VLDIFEIDSQELFVWAGFEPPTILLISASQVARITSAWCPVSLLPSLPPSPTPSPGPHYVAQADLELLSQAILPPPPPKQLEAQVHNTVSGLLLVLLSNWTS
jgi:hypothetical protein